MTVRQFAYSNLNLEFPTSKPLWSPKEGLESLVHAGELAQLPVLNKIKPFLQLTEQEKRLRLFNTMMVNQNIVDEKGNILVLNVPEKVKQKVDKIFLNRSRYKSISFKFPNPIQWYHIALLHELECTQNFNCYLGNGQRWDKRTTIVPKNRGPFKSFEEGAIDAIKYDKLNEIIDWSSGNTLYILEGFNGYGYALYRNINSPYLWSGSNHYTSGKYIADSVYSSKAVSTQIGIALLYKEVLNRL